MDECPVVDEDTFGTTERAQASLRAMEAAAGGTARRLTDEQIAERTRLQEDAVRRAQERDR